jgi:hypothetical protein
MHWKVWTIFTVLKNTTKKKKKKKKKKERKVFTFFNILFFYAELTYIMKVTKKCDVYNFGVVALEILMERHPTELLTSLASSSSQNMMLH